nr:peptidyl-tRNA hydrolase 2, mitochondrial-like [Ipomoea batatas]
MIDMAWLSAVLLGAGCLALGYLIGARHSARIFLSTRASEEANIVVDGKKKKGAKQPLEVEKLADILEDFKLVLVVRNDLKMGKGKIAAQCRYSL